MIAPAVKSALVECKDFLNSCYPCAITATVEDIYIHPEYRLRGYATALIAKLKEILGATIMHGPDVILLANAKAYEISGEGTDAKRTDPENAKLAQLRLVRMMESAGYAYNTEFSRIKVYDVHAQLGSGRN